MLPHLWLPASTALLISRAVSASAAAAASPIDATHCVLGMCPGPAVVAAVATPLPQILAYVAAMMAGMWVQGVVLPAAKPVVKQA